MIFSSLIQEIFLILFLCLPLSGAEDPHLLAAQEKAKLFGKKILLPPQIKEVKFSQRISHTRTFLNADEILAILQQANLAQQAPLSTPPPEAQIDISTIYASFGTIHRLDGGFYSDQIYRVSLIPEAACNAPNLASEF